MRIRTVKPELFRHEPLFNAEKSEQLPLRLAFAGLFGCCDREGRFRWRPRQLKLDVLPYDEVDMESVLVALVKHGFLLKYEVHGEYYGCIPSWHKHQHINQREAPSILPALEEEKIISVHEQALSEYTATSDQSRCAYVMKAGARTCIHVHARGEKEGKGKGKGREMEEEQEGGCQGEGGNSMLGADIRCFDPQQSFVALKTRPGVNADLMNLIFDHWKTVMKHPHAKLDASRRNTIRKALKSGYTAEQLCEAITGCSVTPHNMGDNDRGQRYDGLHVILGNADQIDRFINNSHQPPRAMTFAEKQNHHNVHHLRNWALKKLQGVAIDEHFMEQSA